MNAARLPAVVTAGGRLTGDLAAEAGTTIKALAPIGGTPLIHTALAALRAAKRIGTIAVVGPADALVQAGAAGDHTLEEGETGPENVRRGLAAVRADAGEGLVVVSTSDLPFVTSEAVDALLERAPADADIVFPVVTREAYLDVFPRSPNTFAPLAGRFYTGGSVLLVRPTAIERNHALIERVFAARKSQTRTALLLGLPFLLRFAARRLTIAQAEARASALTGCRCHALLGADPRLAMDVDTLDDYRYAKARWEARRCPS